MCMHQGRHWIMTGSRKPNEHGKALAVATSDDVKAHAKMIANFKEATSTRPRNLKRSEWFGSAVSGLVVGGLAGWRLAVDGSTVDLQARSTAT